MRSISVAGEGLVYGPLTLFSKSQSGLRKKTSPAGRGKLSCVIACAVYIFLCSHYAHAGVLSDAPPSPLELQITGSTPSQGKVSIGLKIINHADHEVAIQRGIEIDTLVNFKWIARMQIEANAGCTSKTQIRIDAGGTFDIVPWDGYQCSNGCNAECDDHRPLGSGTYQFVVVTAEGQRQPSPSFTLP